MNRENTERYSAMMDAPEKTVTQLKEDNERLTSSLYMLQKEREQLRNGFMELIYPSLDQWLNDRADDFFETHFDIANHIDDIADALPEKEINFDEYEDELRDVVRDIIKYAEIKIEI